jgi:uncharacterized protein YoxC
MQGNAEAIVRNNLSVLNLGDDVNKVSGIIENITRLIHGYTEETEGLNDSLYDLPRHTLAARDATKQLGDAADDAAEDIKDLTKSLFELFNINQSVAEAEEKYKEVIEDKSSSIYDQQDALENYMESIERAIESDKTSLDEKVKLIGKYGELSDIAVETGTTTREEVDKTTKAFAEKYGVTIPLAIQKLIDKEIEAYNTTKALREEIDKLKSKEITITTIFASVGSTSASIAQFKQSGGLVRNTGFATDLNIPLVKGEAVLPAAVVRAIKQSNGSFAGLDSQIGGGSVSNYFNISEMVVREEADIKRIAESLYSMQQVALRGAGIR